MSLTPEEQARYDQIMAWRAEDKNDEGIANDWFRYTDFVRYDPATGQILGIGRMALAALARAEADHAGAFLHQTGSLDRHWVDVAARVVRPKTDCPATLTGQTLSGLPRPCTIRITDAAGNSTDYPCTDPTADLAFDYPGTYTITILSVPFNPGVFTLTV